LMAFFRARTYQRTRLRPGSTPRRTRVLYSLVQPVSVTRTFALEAQGAISVTRTFALEARGFVNSTRTFALEAKISVSAVRLISLEGLLGVGFERRFALEALAGLAIRRLFALEGRGSAPVVSGVIPVGFRSHVVRAVGFRSLIKP